MNFTDFQQPQIHCRLKIMRELRVMFYYPQRTQAIRIQETLETLYQGIGGKYFYGDSAWQYIRELTGIDLLEILEKIALSREQ